MTSDQLTLHGAEPRFARGLRDLGNDLWAWIQPNGELGEANAGLVRGEGESLLIDTLWDQRLAREMLDAMEPLVTGAPISRAVNTHSDGDHWWGNGELESSVQIITGTTSSNAMHEDISPRELSLLAGGLGLAAKLPGPLRGRLTRASSPFAPFDFGGVTLRYPDRTFTDRQTIEVGGRSVDLIEVGPAHTVGDLVAHVPDGDTVFAADILFNGVLPIMWAGPASSWLEALDTIGGLEADTYVPGHGPVGGIELVESMKRYWRWMLDVVPAQRGQEISRLDAARTLVADPGFDEWRTWDGAERMVANVDAMYREIDGRGLIGSKGPGRLALFGEMGSLAAELTA